ncbi:type II toxin-antitoxin system VapC family toxin [Candidatus Thiosymbion oneisti]|uniref:type II toxin-antitoxin system VapC family toxin n=1 Tax=Candidatus Thiosymbion oneisti TaxID=589554 RepID=UPI000B7EFC53|nr:type II toxin-antitoxin system VapC family toxin [Candidatus Thiosymbion oneisti]
MSRYMLDTNTVSHLLRQHPMVAKRVETAPMAALCVSAITAGELWFGLAKRPGAKRLGLVVREFLRRVDALPWDNTIAQHYGTVRTAMERQGRILAPLDLLIAAHALGVGAVLVTNDQAFGQVPDLMIEDWTR